MIGGAFNIVFMVILGISALWVIGVIAFLILGVLGFISALATRTPKKEQCCYSNAEEQQRLWRLKFCGKCGRSLA